MCMECRAIGPVDRDGTAWLPNCAHAEERAVYFRSEAERNRGAELSLLQRQGMISGLECQPKVDLKVNGVLVCTYTADFQYREGKAHEVIIWEEVKPRGSKRDPDSWRKRDHAAAIKVDLFRALFPMQPLRIHLA